MQNRDCEKRAEEVRLEFNPDNLSPFPFEEISRCLDDLSITTFSFKGEDLSKLSGAISYNNDNSEYSIYINESKPHTRQYFTTAHELGHYFLHKEIIETEGIIVDSDFFDGNRSLLRLDGATTSRIETEANVFAAALIMPAHLVKEAWYELEEVEECAKVFNVSVSAMSIRLEKLGLLKV